MKKILNFKRLLIFGVIMFGILLVTQAVYTVTAEPGGQDDPVIVQSYLEQVVVPQIKEYIDQKVSAIAGNNVNTGNEAGQNLSQSQQGDQFQIVTIKPGQRLIGGASTEMILRQGRCTVIATSKGGVADVTQGGDISNGGIMPPNHLLIIPLGDGRGFLAAADNQKDVIIMVRGTYTIQN